MAIVAPPSFEGILGNAWKWDKDPFLTQQAANASKRIETESLERVAGINARNALDQLALRGKIDKADRLLAAELERRQGGRQALLNFASKPMGNGGRFAGGPAAEMLRPLLARLEPRSAAQVLGDANALLEEGTRGRTTAEMWAVGSEGSRAIEGLGWSQLFG